MWNALLPALVTLALHLLLAPTAALATVNHGDFVGSGVDFKDVSETTNTAGDPEPLWGDPELSYSGSSLVFSPDSYISSCNGSATSDTTVSTLTTTIQSQSGVIIQVLSFQDAGDAILASAPPFGTPATNASTAFSGTATVLETTSGPIAPVAIPFTGTFTKSTFALPTNFGSNGWQGSVQVNVVSAVPSATKVHLSLTHSLAANCGTGPGGRAAVIQMKAVSGPGVTVLTGTAPTVEITSPADGALTNQTSVAVSGPVTGSPTPSVSVNGVAATVTSGTYSASVPLASEGANALVATATNAFGSDDAQVTVQRDTTPPEVVITAPAQGAELHEEVVPVTGTVTDASPITALAIDGDPLPPGNMLSTTAQLIEGPNTLTVTATDAVGNSGEGSVTVTFTPTVPLTITIATPPNGALVSADRISVAGLVSDPAASVRVNAIAATVTNGTYVAAAVPLVEGANTLTATATRGSDTATASVTITYNAPPVVHILTPSNGAVLREAIVDVEGVVDDPTAFVDVNGVVARVGSAGRFVAGDVTLSVGDNPLEARAIDPFGAQGTDRVTVTRDDGAARKLRIVAVELRDPFALGGFGERRPLPYDGLARFEAGLRALGLEPLRYAPPFAVPVVGFEGLLFVFSEDEDLVELHGFEPLLGFDPPIPLGLAPIHELEADLAQRGLGGLRPEIEPDDFEPQFYGVLTFSAGGPEE